MTISDQLIDELLKGCERAEDLLGEAGLLKVRLKERMLGGELTAHLGYEAKDALVKQAILRMQQNIEYPKTIEDLSEDLDIARRTLERRFMADLGQSPQKIYMELRLDRAMARLRGTEDSIAEIALSSGFCDAPHLSRAMKAERGVTPAQYRKTHPDRNPEAKAKGARVANDTCPHG
jgi:transcriptional regulator GlxA family with amidase domain